MKVFYSFKSIKFNTISIATTLKVFKYVNNCRSSSSSASPSSLSSIYKHYELKTPLFKKILSKELLLLSEAFFKNNFELRIAGGAVRDLLMDIQPHDIDLATNALPNQMIEICDRENFRIFNQKGLKHGTVAIRINEKSNFEITTLRIDTKTYGRHAEVEFTNDWHKDAIRRDLTVNSLFLDFDGTVHDYVNGVEDLKNRIIRFVGIPDKRVKEDYLRILRYFRFYSRVCLTPDNHDEQSLKAIRDNVDGLKLISGERIGYEFRKILSQRFSDSFIKIFYDYKIAPFIGLPKDGDVEAYSKLYKQTFEYQPKTMTLLSSIIKTKEDAQNLDNRIKLSKEEKYLLNSIKKYLSLVKDSKSDEEVLMSLKKLFLKKKTNIDRPLKKDEAIEIAKCANRFDLISKIQDLELPVNPFSAQDLLNFSVYDETENKEKLIDDLLKNKKIKFNYLFNDLRDKWLDSNCTLSKEELFKSLNRNYLENYLIKDKKSKKN